jgi:hypothetical protein
VITAVPEEHRVASVHMNHFLMAALGFETYQEAFLRRLNQVTVPTGNTYHHLDCSVAQETYRWDSPKVASFKYLFNFVLDPAVRDEVVTSLFEEHIADQKSFSSTLYLNWEEARQMQSAGMIIGGHSHQHKPLASLGREELNLDLRTCQRLLVENLSRQSFWPFCYPYGKQSSFNGAASGRLKEIGFSCSFSTEVGSNLPGTDLFALHRHDCKDIVFQ